MPNIETKEMSCLVSLLRYGLFGGALPAVLPTTEEEWRNLFDATRRQAVTALAYDAVLKLPHEARPPRSVLFHFLTLANAIESDNRRREEALGSFANLVAERLRLPTVVVKGSSLACLYPEPLHRECGDNDLYTGADTERIGALMESLGIAVDRKDPRHIAFSYAKTTFECHSYLLYHNDDIVWETKPLVLENDANVSSDVVCFGKMLTLQTVQSAFFLAKHCEHHAVFFHNPVRLRTLLDWSLLLGSDGFDFEAFAQLKSGTDVDIFANLMTHYCNKLFGLHLRCGEERLARKGLDDDDFERIYMHCPERHRRAVVRVVRRSWKYLRFRRQYRAVYGQSMFRRFYFKNLGVAVRQHL